MLSKMPGTERCVTCGHFIQYYSRFLPGLATTLAPLHRLLKKYVQWRWTSEEQRAYERCKTSLSSEALLVHYDTKRELRLACGASSHGLVR